MPKVLFEPSKKSIEVTEGTSLYDAALSAGLPVASSCNADFVCGRCNMTILEGRENLSPQSEMELKLLRRDKKPLDDRISCQTLVTSVKGNVKVTTPYW